MIKFNEIKAWKLIPYEKFTIRSSMDKEQVLSSLNLKIEKRPSFAKQRNQISYKEYVGVISDKEFKIGRSMKIGYNSFKPMAIGKFNNTDLNIEITIRPHKAVLIFFGIVFVFGLTIFIPTSNLSEMHFNWGSMLIPLLFYLLLIVSYNVDRSLIKDDLMKILNGVELKQVDGEIIDSEM